MSFLFPPILGSIKFGIWVIILVITIFEIFTDKNSAKINLIILISFIITISLGLIIFILGLINGNTSYALIESKVFIFYPFLFLVILLYINNIFYIKIIEKSIIYISFFIGIIFISFLIYGSLVNPVILTKYPNLFKIIAEGGTFKIFSDYLNTFCFFSPFVITYYLLNKDNRSVIVKLSVLVNILIILFMGRRAYWVTFVLSLILAILFTKIYFPKIISIKKIILTSVIIFIFFLSIINPDNYMSAIKSITKFDKGRSNQIRLKQYDVMYSKILEKPLMGHGLGAYSHKYFRESKTPYHYELSYVSLIMKSGIFIFLLYIIIFSLNFIPPLFLRENKYFIKTYIPFFIATISLLIANFTNPYIYKMSFMLNYFSPLFLINLLFTRTNINLNNKLA